MLKRLFRPRSSYAAMVLCAAFGLAGCTRNTVLVMAPISVQTVPPGVCLKAADTPAVTPAPLPSSYDVPTLHYPDAATAAGVHIGCAGILFRIDPQGRATDEQLISEFPEGYGFGDLGLSILSHARYATGVTDPNWHFGRIIIRQAHNNRPPVQQAPASVQPVRPWGLVTERLAAPETAKG